MKTGTALLLLIGALLGVVVLNALNIMMYAIGRAVGGGLVIAIFALAFYWVLTRKKTRK